MRMETLEWIRLIVGSAFLVCGIVIFFTELFGVFHFNYVLNRMHAAAMGDTLGISACLIGLIIFSGINFTSLKLLLIICFLWFSSPVSSHMLSRLEIATNDNLEAHCQIYDKLEDLENELSEGADDSAEHTMGGETL
jgi:multicomponent Na+:H+ antiporter subunit G